MRSLVFLFAVAVGTAGLLCAPVATAQDGPPERQRPSPEKFFKHLDKDADGALSVEELPTRLKDAHKEALIKADENKDKKLDLEEFKVLGKAIRRAGLWRSGADGRVPAARQGQRRPGRAPAVQRFAGRRPGAKAAASAHRARFGKCAVGKWSPPAGHRPWGPPPWAGRPGPHAFAPPWARAHQCPWMGRGPWTAPRFRAAAPPWAQGPRKGMNRSDRVTPRKGHWGKPPRGPQRPAWGGPWQAKWFGDMKDRPRWPKGKPDAKAKDASAKKPDHRSKDKAPAVKQQRKPKPEKKTPAEKDKSDTPGEDGKDAE